MTPEPLALFSGLALKPVLENDILPAFSALAQVEVRTTFEPTTVLERLIDDGACPDVLIGVAEAVRRLANDGILAAGSLTPLVRSGIGIAVPDGAPIPPISTVDELVSAIRGARSVAYSRTGASGAHFSSLLERLGIADEVNARAHVMERGFTARALVSGEADLAVQQIVELATVPGVQIVGPLPAEVQHHVELWAALGSDATGGPASDLLDFLMSDTAVDAYRAGGLEPDSNAI